jgi:hypothetical protein
VRGLLLFVPASYVAGYFLTVEEANYWPGERYAARVYHYKWQVTLFKPAEPLNLQSLAKRFGL